MVTCPECKKGPNYKRKGWFIRHMSLEHNWDTSEAERYWHNARCPECGHILINPILCNYCGYLTSQRLRDLEAAKKK